MNTPTRVDDAPLDHFEASLLRELKQIVAEHPTGAPAPPQRTPLWRRPAVRLTSAAAAAALAVGGYLASPLGTSPAFAVDAAADGTVTVTINRLEGAQALEDALAAEGIRADVTYPAQGRQCRAGRYDESTPVAGAPGPATGGHGNRVSVQSGSAGDSFTIRRDLLKPGQTLVIESMWPAEGTWAMKLGIATGPVGACVEEDFAFPAGVPGGPGDLVPPGGSPTSFATGY